MTMTKRRPNCRRGSNSHMTACVSNFRKLMKSIFALVAILLANGLLGAEPGSSVVVIYNSKMKESKQVADYYAQKRDVPAAHVIGFALPESEIISRADYLEKLEKPLLKQL